MTQVQDYTNEKNVALSIKTAKITGRLLAGAMKAFVNKARSPTTKHGNQSIKSLTKNGAAIENVEISGDNIGSFKKIARKYNVDFALKKDSNSEPPNWIVFFKCKDAKALDAAFKEYYNDVLKQKKAKQSVIERLENLSQKSKEKSVDIEIPIPKKAKNKGDVDL